MADLSAIKPTERIIEIYHPANENQPIGLRWSVVSMSDPRMKKIKRAIQDEKLRLETRGKHFKADDLENNVNTLIFNASTGWEWYSPTGDKADELTFHGEKPAFNRVNVNAVLAEFEWISNQVAEAISDEKAFFQHSKTS